MLTERRRARWRRAAVAREERRTSSRAESCVERRGLASAGVCAVAARRMATRLIREGMGMRPRGGCSLSRDWWNYRWCLGAVGGTLETRARTRFGRDFGVSFAFVRGIERAGSLSSLVENEDGGGEN